MKKYGFCEDWELERPKMREGDEWVRERGAEDEWARKREGEDFYNRQNSVDRLYFAVIRILVGQPNFH